MSRQTLGLIVAASLLAGWLLASTMSPPVASSQVAPARRPAAVPARVEPAFEQLRQRLAEAPPAPVVTRNPFAFDERHPPASEDAAPPAAVDAPAGAPAPWEAAPPPAPSVLLSGIATEAGEAGPRRTAILSLNGELWMVVAGEALPDGRRVVRVDEDAVVLADPSGHESVVRLP